MRIAIVGCGPKGLYALERLLSHSAASGAEGLEIDVYESHPAPGAGPVYDPSQPPYLPMNFPSRQVDMWWRGDVSSVVGRQDDFSAWCGRPGGEYAPRAEVGRYLTEGLSAILEAAPNAVRAQIVPTRVDEVRSAPNGWMVIAAGDTQTYEQVMLTTGHQPLPTGGVTVPTSSVSPGSTVAVRGFALTFIDAMLAMTEGRGGRFCEDRATVTYESSGAEPRRIIPFSRSGRPMQEKCGADETPLTGTLDTSHSKVGGATPIGDLETTLIPTLADLVVADVRPAALQWLRSAIRESGGQDLDPDIRASLTGRDEVKRSLGSAWRAAYPAVVRALGGEGLAAEQWPAFRRLAAEMERIAFGPPPISVRKLLALVDAGIVDLGHLRDHEPAADVTLEAVMPPPGVPASGPVANLFADGHVRVAPGRRGIETDEHCFCVASDGTLSEGLAAYGRPTEDWVIGNDTLSRTLHPAVDGWARSLVRQRIAA